MDIPMWLKNYYASVVLNKFFVPLFQHSYDKEVDLIFMMAVEAAKKGNLKITPGLINSIDGNIYELTFEFDNCVIHVDWNQNRWYSWGHRGSAIDNTTNEKLEWFCARPGAWTMYQLKPFISGPEYEGPGKSRIKWVKNEMA